LRLTAKLRFRPRRRVLTPITPSHTLTRLTTTNLLIYGSTANLPPFLAPSAKLRFRPRRRAPPPLTLWYSIAFPASQLRTYPALFLSPTAKLRFRPRRRAPPHRRDDARATRRTPHAAAAATPARYAMYIYIYIHTFEPC